MNDLSVLIVEDDYKTKENFYRLKEKYIKKNIKIINITSSSYTALETISKSFPEAIILDLELHDGSGSGFDVLQGLKNLKYKPFILVTTNNTSAITQKWVRDLGADLILSKYEKDYSETKPLDLLVSLRNTIISDVSLPTYEYESPEEIDRKNKLIEKKLTQELNAIHIPIKSVGYRHLSEAIRLKILTPEYSLEELKKIIATSKGKTPDSVVASMQVAIDKTWKSSDPEDLLINYSASFNVDRGAPTVSEFISYYADKIKIDV